MSLMLYGSSEPEPAPGPAPDGRRRYLVIFFVVIALILGGGSAAFLLLDSSPSINQTSPNAYTPPADGSSGVDPTGTDGPSASPSGSASPSASPSHSPSPSRSASAHPSSSTPVPVGVTFHAPNGVLCPSVDLQPLSAMQNNAAPGPSDDYYTDKSNYVDYGCRDQVGKVTATVDAMIFNDGPSAAASYASYKSTTGGDKIPNVGTDAFGYVFQTTTYILFALDGNLVLKIQLNSAGGVPTPARLRDDGAVRMGPGTIRNLAVKV